MPTSTATSTQRALLLTLGRDIIDNYAFSSGGGDVKYFSGGFWQDDSSVEWDHRLGLSALAAVMWRVARPREDRYRRYAVNSIDTFFATKQVPIVTPGVSSLSNGGGIFRTSAANVQAENGTAGFFAGINLAVAICALGLESRWKTQILGMCDYAKAAGERTYYTNGNINLMKAVLFYLGARVSGFDATRVADFETTMDFLYAPNAVAGGTNWRGLGYVEDTAPSNIRGTGGVGYFAELSSISAATDYTGQPRYDTIYTAAQAEYAATGYLISGHIRFLRAMRATMGKLFAVAGALNTTTSVVTAQTGDSRNTPGAARTFNAAAWPMLVWVLGDTDSGGFANTELTQGTNGVDAYQRSTFNSVNAINVRNSGYGVGGLICAAHGILL